MSPTDHWGQACIHILKAVSHLDRCAMNHTEYQQVIDYMHELQNMIFARQPPQSAKLPPLEMPGEFIE